jgi:DNA-binding transcriptional ArsR family regulator
VSPRADPAARLQALDEVVAALAHPARRQILLTVHLRGEMSAGEIAGRFAHAWPTTTRHLRVLEHAGLMRYERDGRRRVYRVEHARLALVSEWLAWFSEEQTWVEASLSRSVASASRSPTPRRR